MIVYMFKNVYRKIRFVRFKWRLMRQQQVNQAMWQLKYGYLARYDRGEV
jgi:hypothetical protein